MQILASSSDRGFAELPVGERVETFDQFFNMATQDWQLSSFFTSDNEINKGRVPYRRPVTLRARAALLPSVIGKIWRKRVMRH